MTTTNLTCILVGHPKAGVPFFPGVFIIYIILDPNGFLPYADPFFNLFIKPLHTFIP
jgi:hypothetical protein